MSRSENQTTQGLCPVRDGYADGVAVLRNVSVNWICAAVGAIETIATLLANRAHGFGAVYLTQGRAAGGLPALSICGEMINAEAMGSGQGIHLKTVNPGSGKVLELARQALQEARS